MTLKRDEYGNQVQAMHPYASQSVAIGAASVSSQPFAYQKESIPPIRNTGDPIVKNQRTLHVRLVATVACWASFGSAPVAAKAGSSSVFIPAGIPEYFWVRPSERIAAITDSGSLGSLYVTELANN